jgi:foldase protein PrsA
MKLSRTIAALGAFFVLALGVAACGGSSNTKAGGIPSGSVAVMAGSPVSLQAWKHWMYVAAKGQTAQSPGSPVIVPNDPPGFTGCIAQVRKQIPSLSKISDKQIKSDCGQLFTSLNTQVMDFLLEAYWYQAEGHKLKIHVTSAEVQKALVAAKKANFPTATAYKAFLAASGETNADILFRLTVTQIYTKLEDRYLKKPTTAEIAAYYTSHPTQFGTPETRDLRLIRTSSEAQINLAKAALVAGKESVKTWQTVAKKYSIDAVTKSNGGLLTGVTKGEEEHALDVAAFSAPANKLVGPIHGTFGWYMVEVTKITPATTQSLTKATPLIKSLLSGQDSTAAQKKVATLVKVWVPKTLCRTQYSMADCQGYKPPKPTATTPTVTAPTTTPTSTATASGSVSASSSASTSSSSSASSSSSSSASGSSSSSSSG